MRALALIAFLVAACASPAATPAQTPAPTAAAGVAWSDYASGLQARIDRLALEKDCPGLQIEFDTAGRGNAATRARTGHGNAELMTYIDGRLKAAGCYR